MPPTSSPQVAAEAPPAEGWAEGWAYNGLIRWGSPALALILSGWLGWLWLTDGFGPRAHDSALFVWSCAAALMMFPLGWMLNRSRTRLDAVRLEQSWLWPKVIARSDLVHARLIHVRGLEWIIVPRLLARGTGLKLVTLYCADRTVLAEAQRIVANLRDRDA